MRESMAAIKHLESAVTNAEGIDGVVLRYASFYGPTGDIGEGGSMVELIKKRRMPIIGDGSGVWSFIHYDDAAAATVKAIESDVTGVLHVADDDPAQAAVWLPELAKILGAKRAPPGPGLARPTRGGRCRSRRLHRDLAASTTPWPRNLRLAARLLVLARRFPPRPLRRRR